MKRIVCYGAGTNSTAMLVGLTNTGIILDYIIFSDTGGEKKATYDFIPKFSEWLQQHGQPAVTIVRYKNKNGQEQTLEQEMLNRKTLPSIAYGYKSCSEKYKQRPINKFLRNIPDFFDGEKPIKYLGFDAAEHRRAKPDPFGHYENLFPLIEWGWRRKECIEEIQKVGLCPPPKSSCFFCPNMTKPEILALPEDLQKRAVDMEQNAKPNLIELKGLGRRFAWGDLIKADEDQQKAFDDLDMYQSPCECVDG